jgi:hypothetical protein
MLKTISPTQIRIARYVAISADLLQIGLFPLFGEGFLSPLADALDVIVCVILTRLIGWHYSFLPSFLVEIMPVVDLVPTWTIAVLLATRQKAVATSGTTQVYDQGAARPLLREP